MKNGYAMVRRLKLTPFELRVVSALIEKKTITGTDIQMLKTA